MKVTKKSARTHGKTTLVIFGTTLQDMLLKFLLKDARVK
jgi:hypothetical protein